MFTYIRAEHVAKVFRMLRIGMGKYALGNGKYARILWNLIFVYKQSRIGGHEVFHWFLENPWHANETVFGPISHMAQTLFRVWKFLRHPAL